MSQKFPSFSIAESNFADLSDEEEEEITVTVPSIFVELDDFVHLRLHKQMFKDGKAHVRLVYDRSINTDERLCVVSQGLPTKRIT